jgi:hypothetical protein
MRREPTTITLLGQALGVRTARIASILLLLVAVVGGLEVRERGRRAAARPEAERIRERHGALLVEVSPIAPPPGRSIVDVPDFAALVRIAERYGLVVLHWHRGSTDTYLVQDEEAFYRYRTSDDAGPEGDGGARNSTGAVGTSEPEAPASPGSQSAGGRPGPGGQTPTAGGSALLPGPRDAPPSGSRTVLPGQ